MEKNMETTLLIASEVEHGDMRGGCMLAPLACGEKRTYTDAPFGEELGGLVILG